MKTSKRIVRSDVDPMTGNAVKVVTQMRDRKLQRALMQFFKPENWFEVREALVQAQRTELIGTGCDALIPPNPPKEAIEAKRRKANEPLRGDHYHSVANPAAGEPAGERGAEPPKTKGYRPGRKTQQRRGG
jgi:Domain of unknown function (DUF3362)